MVELDGFQRLQTPITLADLRDREDELRRLKESLEERHQGALYYPFALSDKRPLRPSQGYLFKLPAGFLKVFPALKIAIEEGSGTPPQQVQREAVAAMEGTQSEKRGTAGGQGFSTSAERNGAIEQRAMEAARAYFEEKGYALRDTSANRPYDYVGSRGDEKLYVEVKGTTSEGESIILTRNEVLHAQDERHRCILFVLHGINIDEGEEVRATGGVEKVISPWEPAEKKLTPISYLYEL